MRTTTIILLLLSTVLILGCNNEIPRFSEIEPFAIEIKRVRGYYEAEKINKRLQSKSIPSYLYNLEDKKGKIDNWYIVLSGASKDSVEIAKEQIDLREVTKIDDSKIVNFNRLKNKISEVIPTSIKEIDKIKVERPDVPEEVYDLIAEFPEDNMFKSERVNVYNFSNHSKKYFQPLYDNKLDLPRGVKRKDIIDNSNSFAEVIFRDNLYNDRVTIEILNLKKDHVFSYRENAKKIPDDPEIKSLWQDIALFFVSRILNTGNYSTENYEQIKVNAKNELNGYKVVIEPRAKYFRTYFVLVDEKNRNVIFSQSTDKNDDEMIVYLEGFGRSSGMINYNNFYNSFFTIPKCLEEGDEFIGFSSEVLTNSYAKSKGYTNWATAMVGHTVSKAMFFNSIKKMQWDCAGFDLLTPEKRENIYQGMYANRSSSGKVRLDVKGQLGYYVSASLFGRTILKEHNFSTNGRHIMAIDCQSCRKDEFLARAKKFQTGYDDPDYNPCSYSEKNTEIILASSVINQNEIDQPEKIEATNRKVEYTDEEQYDDFESFSSEKEVVNTNNYVVTTMDDLRFRKRPNLKSEILDGVPLNTKLNFQGRKSSYKQKIEIGGVEYQDYWYHVEYQGKEGWVFGGGIKSGK